MKTYTTEDCTITSQAEELAMQVDDLSPRDGFWLSEDDFSAVQQMEVDYLNLHERVKAAVMELSGSTYGPAWAALRALQPPITIISQNETVA